jgi:tetratricopeptide (TPR) repeat protein
VRLSPKTFDALLLLVRNAERLVLRQRLIEMLWPDTFVTEANLTNIIVTLRKVLGAEAIQTVSKYGYRFTLPVVGEPGIDPTSYGCFMRGKELAVKRSLESMATARDLFSLCVTNDPTFAASWAWLGRCCRFLEKLGPEASINPDLAEASLRRALVIDPNLACAHHFLVQIQADLGKAREAMVRLANRLCQHEDEPESYAGLVTALRYCGLLEDSVAAHERAVALDPIITTGVSHTHFLRCDYEATLDTYGSAAGYLDAAALAAQGHTARATGLLEQRLSASTWGPLLAALIGSLLAILQGHREDAVKIMKRPRIVRDPESLFYFARHFSLAGASGDAVAMLRRARLEGFTSSTTLQCDRAFALLRGDPGFEQELIAARGQEEDSRRALLHAARGHLKLPSLAGIG